MHQHSGHSHQAVKGKNLWYSILLNIGITVAQVVGGLVSGSLSLLSDALDDPFWDIRIGAASVASRIGLLSAPDIMAKVLDMAKNDYLVLT